VTGLHYCTTSVRRPSWIGIPIVCLADGGICEFLEHQAYLVALAGFLCYYEFVLGWQRLQKLRPSHDTR
jgi:hypothetical protein